MLVGSMNFPGRSLAKEIHRVHEEGFDFIDLTLEPPAAWLPDGKEVGRLIKDLGLQVVGHTAWHLPIASPFTEVRQLASELFTKCLDVFADAEVELVNIHPDQRVPMHGVDQIRAMNAEAIKHLSEVAAARGIRLMVENLDRMFGTVEDLQPIFEAVPEAGFHLDVAHANLRLGLTEPNRSESLIKAFGDRLVHVHVSDNSGGTEDRLAPLGAGFIDWKRHIRLLKEHGYDSTVTLEVFSREREHLRTSRKLWLKWWTETK